MQEQQVHTLVTHAAQKRLAISPVSTALCLPALTPCSLTMSAAPRRSNSCTVFSGQQSTQAAAPEGVEVGRLAQQQLQRAKQHDPAGDALHRSRCKLVKIGRVGRKLQQDPAGDALRMSKTVSEQSGNLTLVSHSAQSSRRCPAQEGDIEWTIRQSDTRISLGTIQPEMPCTGRRH